MLAQMVKNRPAMQETQVQSLDQEDPLEKGMANHCSILAWRIPWTEESGRLQSMGSQRVGHNWVTNTQDMDVPKCPSAEDVVCNYIVFKVRDYHWDGTWPFEGPVKWTVWMWGLLLGVNIQNSAERRCAGWFLHQIQWGKMNSGTCIRFGYTF